VMVGRLAQLEERRPYKAKVAGSRPAAPTKDVQKLRRRSGGAWRLAFGSGSTVQ
jgi:hypothetical protein